jgi:hypothetical protein
MQFFRNNKSSCEAHRPQKVIDSPNKQMPGFDMSSYTGAAGLAYFSPSFNGIENHPKNLADMRSSMSGDMLIADGNYSLAE